MLFQLRDYIRREKVVSTQQLTREFKIDLQALLPMLDCWVKKGVIEACDQKKGCQSRCFGCKKDSVHYFRFMFKNSRNFDILSSGEVFYPI